MSSSEVPEPWATRMTERGFTRRDGGPNVSALARAMGVSVETARRAVKGIGTPDPETVTALVDQLGADVEDWTGQRVADGPYVPPSESALLTGPQRDALTDLIRAIAAGQRQRAGGEHADSSAPRYEAGAAGTTHHATGTGKTDAFATEYEKVLHDLGEMMLQVRSGGAQQSRERRRYQQLVSKFRGALEAHGTVDAASAYLAKIAERDLGLTEPDNVQALTGPDQGNLVEVTGMAARPGTPDHAGRDTAGEESQVTPEDNE